MTTNSSSQRIVLQVKLLDKKENAFSFVSIDTGAKGTLIETFDSLGNWKTANIGDFIDIQIPISIARTIGLYRM